MYWGQAIFALTSLIQLNFPENHLNCEVVELSIVTMTALASLKKNQENIYTKVSAIEGT